MISSSVVNNSLFINFLETDKVFCLWLLAIMNNFSWRSYCFAMQSLAELSILIRTKYANKSFFMQALYISVLRVAGTLLQIFATNSSNEMDNNNIHFFLYNSSSSAFYTKSSLFLWK